MKKRKKQRECHIQSHRAPLENPPSCPVCREVLDGITSLSLDAPNGSLPEAGDLTVCGYCGSVLTFDDPSHLRLATDKEFQFIHPDLRRIVTHPLFPRLRKPAAGTPFGPKRIS